MTERRRWLESEEIDPDMRELLRAAPRPRAMTADERARSARSLGRIAALPVAAGLMFWIQNVALAGLLGGAAGLVVSTGVIYLTPESGERALPVQAAAAPSSAPRHEVARAPAIEPAAPPVQAKPVKRVASAPPKIEVAPDSLALETKKLEQARRRLASDPSAALSLLGEHAREFPNGKLGAERELLTIDALSRVGRTAEARSRAEAMLARSRGGLYEQRLERMLRTMP